MKHRLNLLKNIVKFKGFSFLFLVLIRYIEKCFRVNVLRHKTAIKKINKMYRMRLDLAGPGFDQELFLFRNREQLETKIVRDITAKGMNILDLGANIGYYTLLLANLTGNNGKVYAVEPLPQNYEKLQSHLLLNNIKNVEAFNAAISAETGHMNFFVGAEHNLGSLVEIATEKQTGRQIRVKAFSLADFLVNKSKIDLIRMDIERGELKVFYNMIDEFPQRGIEYPKMIMFEVHPEGDVDPDPSFTPLLSKLAEIGYKAKYTVSSSNPVAQEKYESLGYTPEEVGFRGHALFSNIKPEHFLKIAARRPKVTRAILLVKD